MAERQVCPQCKGKGWYYIYIKERNNPRHGMPQEWHAVCGFPGCVKGYIDPEKYEDWHRRNGDVCVGEPCRDNGNCEQCSRERGE